MRITVELMDDYTLIRCHSNFDAHMAIEARKVFNDVISHVDRNVVLDLGHSNYLDSSGLGAIAFLHKRLISLGFTLELIGLKDQPFKMINLLKVNDAIRCYSFDSHDLKHELNIKHKTE